MRQYGQQSTMTQLSSTSKKAIAHITSLIQAIERVLQHIKDFLLRTCPQFVSNVLTAFQALKDIASFVPSFIYKSLLCIAIFSILWRKYRKWRGNRLASAEPKEQKQREVPVNHSNLENLGPQYLVKSQGAKSFVGNARTEIDSFYLEFEQFDDSRPKDFRDIVFFELMRGYRSTDERPERE